MSGSLRQRRAVAVAAVAAAAITGGEAGVQVRTVEVARVGQALHKLQLELCSPTARVPQQQDGTGSTVQWMGWDQC